MNTAFSPRANPVTPLLCWGSSWPPRWTVSAHVLAANTVCSSTPALAHAASHRGTRFVTTQTSERSCITFSPSLSHMFLWLPSFSVLPRCITHCITTQVTLRSPMSVCCSETPTSPEIPICAVIASSVVCDLGPSLTPGDAECLRLLFCPEKEEWWSDIPSFCNAGSPFFSGASSELLSVDLFLATSWAMSLSITIAALSAYLTPAFSLSSAFSSSAFYHLE